ncbi:MAG: hypothetical protein KAT40_01070, partial [Bacteroidales bacterium]|nr:hypothetical protein [Bacteroidales bacterium]
MILLRTHKHVMRIILSTFVFFLSFFILTYSQAPQSFNYQAVVRDAQGAIIVDQDVFLQISILQGTETGTAVFVETHQKTTNSFGLITIEVGNGSPVFGDFDLIIWSAEIYFLKIELDATGGTVYQHIGTSQLLSVPYALSASSVSDIKKLIVIGPSDQPPDSALFEVKNKDGNTVFAVYNEGVRIYVDDSEEKGLKGGFAVGGFSSSKGGAEYFRVTPDSVRIYIDTTNLKGLKGGFAVGGYSSSKGNGREYLRVTTDSVRVYIEDNPIKGRKGGFAVGGYSPGKSESNSFMYLTPENYFIGHQSGLIVSTGIYNSILGYQSGRNITSGESNAFLGYQSGFNSTEG